MPIDLPLHIQTHKYIGGNVNTMAKRTQEVQFVAFLQKARPSKANVMTVGNNNIW